MCIVSVVLSLGFHDAFRRYGDRIPVRVTVSRVIVNDRLWHSSLLTNGCSDFPPNAAPVEPQRATALYPQRKQRIAKKALGVKQKNAYNRGI